MILSRKNPIALANMDDETVDIELAFDMHPLSERCWAQHNVIHDASSRTGKRVADYRPTTALNKFCEKNKWCIYAMDTTTGFDSDCTHRVTITISLRNVHKLQTYKKKLLAYLRDTILRHLATMTDAEIDEQRNGSDEENA